MQIWKICQYFCLYMKTICWRFHITTSFTFWEIRTWGMWKVCLQAFRGNSIRNLQALRANNSRIIRIKNAKFSAYCFYINTNMQGDFRICGSAFLPKSCNTSRSCNTSCNTSRLHLWDNQLKGFQKILILMFQTE